MADGIALGIGFCCAALGIFMIVTGNPGLLHSYHYATTPAEELPALARETGMGLVGCGVGAALVCQTVLPDVATIVGAVILFVSIAGVLISIVRHNGGLVTFKGTGIFAGTRPWVPTLACGLIGAVLALAGIAFGTYMIVTGDVSGLHSYHYANVAAADLPALALWEGIAMIAFGTSMFICALAIGRMAARPAPLWSKTLLTIGGALFLASILGMLVAIIYFNGSLMG